MKLFHWVIVFLLFGFPLLLAGNPRRIMIEDFEDSNLWSPMTSMGWWHLDEDGVYVYNISKEKAYKSNFSMQLDYKKTAPYQLIAGYFDSINPKTNFSAYDTLQMRVYGAVKILLKLEDRNGMQANIGIKIALDTDKWNKLEFDYSKTDLDKTSIKNIFLFVAPNDSNATGRIYVDNIALSKKYVPVKMVDQLFANSTNSNEIKPFTQENASYDEIPIVSAVDVLVDKEKNLYILQRMGSFIFKYNSKGHYQTEFSRQGKNLGEIKNPLGFTYSSLEDCFYVADTENNRLQKFHMDGILDESFAQSGALTWRGDGKPFGRIVDVAVDLSGSLYILDISDKTIWKYAYDGKSGQLLGHQYDEANFFLKPVRIKVFNGFLYVVDEEARAIYKFTLEGEYVSMAKCLDEKKRYFLPSDCVFDPETETCFVISHHQPGIFVFDKNWNYLGVSHSQKIDQLQYIEIFYDPLETKVLLGDKNKQRLLLMSMQELKDGIV